MSTHGRRRIELLRVLLILIELLGCTEGVVYDDVHDYDAYGTRIASNDHFVVLAQNDAARYVVSMAPFGMGYTCDFSYEKPFHFAINVAVGRNQTSSQLFFVFLRTNVTSGYFQTLGIFRFSRSNSSMSGVTQQTCNRMLPTGHGPQTVKEWEGSPSEMSTLQVDPSGDYAYGFLSKRIFIYDIERSSVQDLNWTTVLPSFYFEPHALDIGRVDGRISMAIVAGYFEFDIEKALPVVYLIRLDPPLSMTIVDNYTIVSNNQKFVRGRNAATYQFNYVMSVSIHPSTQQVLIAMPQLKQTFLFSFNESNLNLLETFNRSARATAWLDDDGMRAGLLLSSESTAPWAQSRVEILNISSDAILYAYPNNQQTLTSWTTTLPAFIRLTTSVLYQMVILSSDGVVVLVPWADAGYYTESGDINDDRFTPNVCPPGTYKNVAGPTPCTICPTNTRGSGLTASTGFGPRNQTQTPTINCTACSNDSFCPLASIVDVNRSILYYLSQAYAYPTSPPATSFDDILMENTFYIQTSPIRCLYSSSFFWSLIVLFIAAVVLAIMGLLYFSPKGVKYFHGLEWFFRHSDLIGNGELWFGGLISFSMIVLIIYSFLFGNYFLFQYPIETSGDAKFACDTSLRNAKFSSSLQLLATIKTKSEEVIFDMLDAQKFYMTVNFLQTGFTCDDIATQENVGTYAVDFVYQSCVKHTNNATLSVTYGLPYHQITLQVNLTGSYYIGGLLICLNGNHTENLVSSDFVQAMKHCEYYYSSNETIGQTTEIAYVMTKVINQTEYLDYSNALNFSGIWIPTSIPGSLNDHLDYQQRGEFHRYLSTEHVLIVSFSETQFYVMNKQEPIARRGEILFHNVLFTTTIIGLFALAFLLFRLTFLPLIRWFVRRQLCLARCFNQTAETKIEVGTNESF